MSNFETIHKAICDTLDSLEADGIIEYEPILLGIKQGAVNKERRTVSFEFTLRDPASPPYRVVCPLNDDLVKLRLRDAILAAVEAG